jgi:hypothetical protein
VTMGTCVHHYWSIGALLPDENELARDRSRWSISFGGIDVFGTCIWHHSKISVALHFRWALDAPTMNGVLTLPGLKHLMYRKVVPTLPWCAGCQGKMDRSYCVRIINHVLRSTVVIVSTLLETCQTTTGHRWSR